jgi:DNA-binding PadR family transcriptional regulator
VSVPNGFLALLTLGPAYGSQLQKELLARAPHRSRLNAGQVYATLERLARSDLVRHSGKTDDGLPLYVLTDTGTQAARSWLSEPAGSADDWMELQDQVLVAASLDTEAGLALVTAYIQLETAAETAGALAESSDGRPGQLMVSTTAPAMATRAARLRQEAVLSWLRDIETLLNEDPTALLRGRNTERPRRGRRRTNETST